MSNYLRNRPFMVISYAYVLKAGQKSNTPGFGDQAEYEPIENMVIVDRVSDKMMNKAELVLDLLNNKVIKCRGADLDHTKLFNVFVERHYGEVKAALSQWIANNPDNLAKVQEFVAANTIKEEPANDEE